MIDGKTYELENNFPSHATGEKKHHLHGGHGGFYRKQWHVDSIDENGV